MSNIAIIVSEFDKNISDKLLEGALNAWHEKFNSVPKIIRVPGAVEIPMMAAKIIDHYSAILCLGCVIQGETMHFDYVCKIVSEGCLQLAIQHKKPVTFGVLTTRDRAQAIARAGGIKCNKGYDSMLCTIKMLDIIGTLG